MPVPRRHGAGGAGRARRGPGRRRHRRQGAGRDLPDPDRARRRPARGRAPRLPRRVRRHAARAGCRTSCSSTPRRRCRSSPIPSKDSYLVPDGCEVHELAGRADDAAGRARGPGRGARRPGRRARPRRRSARAAHGRPHGHGHRRGRRCPAARGRHRLGRGPDLRPLHTRPPRPAGPATRGCASPAAPSARACPWPRARRSPAPTGRCWRWRPTASALYTIQSLWTQAREGLDVTTVIYNNRSYSVLNMELGRVGADGGGPAAQAMLDLHRPDIDFVQIAQGLGVPATRAETADELVTAARSGARHARPGAHRRHRPAHHLSEAALSRRPPGSGRRARCGRAARRRRRAWCAAGPAPIVGSAPASSSACTISSLLTTTAT